ncbi:MULTISPECIES: arginine repressor [Selenomonas]|uniref:Arginine repressor n=1 Tax=Selenomonas ruminis TaxID=2593411 RepID=A0A5D6WDZ9_9FIRM|nr:MULTISPECIES: arginine repressor [unclassified Selenomonas]MBQ1868397.1 arginine repressor [Selenomonas sp.]MCR5438793.1 arginine repressor [Selenomonas sp.]TYZ24744.1 arginine repressor [Selenomonas sp. mPRGC5]SDG53140.1 transcriptional regulator, ArgR family [Selenomonas ruminantium]
MKSVRHAVIKNIIDNQVIETQEDLAEALRERRIQVTQATVSRDIKELMLIKVPTGDGRYRYASPMQNAILFTEERMHRLFADTVTACDYSENIIVVKTLPGGANTVASALDHANWTEVIGTVAGDDNIIMVIKPKEATEKILHRLQSYLK